MSTSLFEILITSFLFLTVVFAIGCIPIYYVKNKESSGEDLFLSMLSLFGMGMLLGTAFMLVIPEGIDACLEHNGNVGINLLIGFLVVYLLDQAASVVSQNTGQTRWSSFLQEGCELTSLRDLLNVKKAFTLVVRNQVVFALVIHGFSDGLAMGASTNNDSVKIATLAAIIIHKIPAVLSLSSLMVTKQKLPTLEAASNLLAFASSTPLAYLVVSLINMKNWGPLEWISGNILLMSGGSLFYAAVSALLGNHSHTNDSHEYAEAHENFISGPTSYEFAPKDMTPFEVIGAAAQRKVPFGETTYVLGGVLIPIIVSYLIREKA
ncbi:LANO_0H24322g1_1 [Lachancea nothofagi CBS 11611]|uniref:LANO_0H24322g1_1 n=1 Tax=Lachancea nothofagi CBS 11611 TaxID=1266666 RepID=A0A1G4KNX5_9SACH|nr:LANO_0H24322g1_1 [Lachancea nothofagi CBS 11611]